MFGNVRFAADHYALVGGVSDSHVHGSSGGDVVLLNQPNERSLGVGEGSQGPTVAAIANAVANATGVRLRDLPFTPARVKAAMREQT